MIIQENIQLSEVLWYKIGGISQYLLTCNNKKDIFEAINFINKQGIEKIFICGYGTNLVFSDNPFKGAVIKITEDYNKQTEIAINAQKDIVTFAGTALDTVITYALRNNFTGLEWAGGLPGSVGAAIRGNVGAYGSEIQDTLYEAEVLIKTNKDKFEIKKLSNKELNFSYRHSLIKENPNRMIVISATFQLNPASSIETQKAWEIYNLRIQDRKNKHPLEYPNCGSVFKNIREPEKIEKILKVFPDLKEKIEKKWYGKVASAYLIQRLGLQGLRIGDAQISEKHALFIVNLNHAKASDVLKVIGAIQNKFLATFGFSLEPEVEIVH